MSLSNEGQSIDQLIDQVLVLCDQLPRTGTFAEYRRRIEDLRERLAHGSLRLAVLGQFNRGKSTFINALLGLPVLPVSVLPITSVPTVIRHGTGPACTIRFADGRPEKHAVKSIEDIERMLKQFVAEENNPHNRKGVSDAVVFCDSSILRHGTVLIDTPGFGSTHVHNTQTTFDLLETCDAALFLFSADLPITQVEVDFLHEARRRVRRMFFIFNKVDLLDDKELSETQDFIRSTLIRKGLSPTGDRLYPVCARHGQKELPGKKKKGVSPESGMEAVRSEIVDFMIKEKYFALSEAVDTKFKDSVERIVAALREEKKDLEEPLEQLRGERQELNRRIESIRGWATSRAKEVEA
ncbi:MAG: hypothetical protein GF344_17450, partial [Chitinivibrionales bacterium]|nr:hypothetical protein [Chitinivibrionales bacterium]MBD3358451.1 hypothetical protein [Chitinivibrionales bacterium]